MSGGMILVALGAAALGALCTWLWLRAREAVLRTTLESERAAAAEKLLVLDDAQERLTVQFKQLSQDILEEKSKRFTEQNREHLEQVLKPLREKIGAFEQQVKETYDKETRDRVALFQQIRSLHDLNRQVSDDAKSLATALRGETRAQGVWGEMILERILELSGLEKGREYETQVVLRGEDGRRPRPDAIVHLPEGRDIVIDAKVSLTAYVRATEAADPAERASALAEHVQSLRNHIRELSGRDYGAEAGVRALDFVLMFVPGESAYVEALRTAPQLLEEAFSKKIGLVSPSTLLPTLRAVENMWRLERQTQNAADIAERAGKLYDKFVGFVTDLEDVGGNVRGALSAYESARRKLVEGPGNLTRQVEMLKKLGAGARKALPENLLREAGEDEEPEKLPERH